MHLDVVRSALTVVPILASPDDRWRLTDPYIEDVWSEFLGPTATLMARRLGRLLEVQPGGVELDLRDFAASLGVAPSLAVRALERLHRFEVIHSDLERGLIGVSGYAPAVGAERAHRLTEAGRVAHERLSAGAAVDRTVPGRASRVLAPTTSPAVARGLVPIAHS